ncbi:protein translocase subunit SecD [Patescibacteria group bacterium]
MTSRRRLLTTLIIIAIVVALAVIIDMPQGPDFDFNKLGFKPKEGDTEADLLKSIKVRLGLDLQGGSQLVYQADLSNIDPADYAEAMAGVRDVIERRVNLFGVSEPKVQVAGENRLIVELAGIKDIDAAIEAIGETPTLEFMEEIESPDIEIQSEGETLEVSEEATEGSEEDRPTEEPRAQMRRLAQENEAAEETSIDTIDLGAGSEEELPELTPEEIEEITSQLTDEEGNPLDVNTLMQQPQFQPTGLSGKNLKAATVVFPQQGVGTPQVQLEFDDEGKRLFAEITERNVGKRVAILIDGVIISAPVVQERISEGNAVITGDFTLDEAKELARNLNAGALPVPIELISRQTVGATLGHESVQKSLIAGLIGLLAVGIFMIAYYRLPGVLAVAALIIYALVVLALFKLIPVTLTLAGVAGFILSVGMAVDANVLIFERFREEARKGKPLLPAIDDGFKGAWISIRDSNISTLITCIILYWFGTSIIKGFALTLGIGVLISMISAITITQTFLKLSATNYIQTHPWWFGIKKMIAKKDKDV